MIAGVGMANRFEIEGGRFLERALAAVVPGATGLLPLLLLLLLLTTTSSAAERRSRSRQQAARR